MAGTTEIPSYDFLTLGETLLRLSPQATEKLAAAAPVHNSDDNMFVEILAPWALYQNDNDALPSVAAVEDGILPVLRAAGVAPSPEELGALAWAAAGAHADQQSAAALLEGVRSSPEEFSPSVLLRPIVQDTLFPTVCYVAGPNELAYLGQLRRVYDAFSIPMPLIQQRATATLVDSNALRFLTRYDVALESLRAQDEAVLNAVLEAQLPPSVEASLDEAVRTLEQRMERLAKEVVQIDPTLEGASRSTLSRMQDDLKKLHGKIIQAAKRKDETLRRQFQNARAQAFPGGEPQERAVGFVYFLNKYGPALVDRLYAELPVDAGTHWVVTI